MWLYLLRAQLQDSWCLGPFVSPNLPTAIRAVHFCDCLLARLHGYAGDKHPVKHYLRRCHPRHVPSLQVDQSQLPDNCIRVCDHSHHGLVTFRIRSQRSRGVKRRAWLFNNCRLGCLNSVQSRPSNCRYIPAS